MFQLVISHHHIISRKQCSQVRSRKKERTSNSRSGFFCKRRASCTKDTAFFFFYLVEALATRTKPERSLDFKTTLKMQPLSQKGIPKISQLHPPLLGTELLSAQLAARLSEQQRAATRLAGAYTPEVSRLPPHPFLISSSLSSSIQFVEAFTKLPLNNVALPMRFGVRSA